MKSIVLFAASKNQLNYFTSLCRNINCDCHVQWYKKLTLPTFLIKYPFTELWGQAKLLVKRKSNARKGQRYPQFVWPILTLLFFIQSIWIFSVFVRWIRHNSNECIGVWNGKKFRQAILVLAANHAGKRTIFFETGPIPGMSSIDPRGVNFYSSIPNEISFYQDRQISSASENVVNFSPEGKVLKLPENYILVPFQVVEDSNIYLHSQWIRNMRQLFNLCEEISAKTDGLCFVFKEHPACNEIYDDLKLRQNSKLKFINELSTTELVKNAKAIVTVNSTVGIEGLMYGKKVFVLGDALFGINGISFPVRNKKELLRVLKSIDEIEPQAKAIESFIDYLKNEYAIPGNAMKAPGNDHWTAAEERIKLLLSGENEKALGLLNNNYNHSKS